MLIMIYDRRIIINIAPPQLLQYGDVSDVFKSLFIEGQRKTHYEENEAEKKQNNDIIETLKKEIKLRLEELAQAREVVGDEEAQVKKYINSVCPISDKTSEQVSTKFRTYL